MQLEGERFKLLCSNGKLKLDCLLHNDRLTFRVRIQL